MTAKDKAMEIAMKFDKYGQTDNAVKCALICVDEILELQLELAHDDNVVNIEEFYIEVKQEINKL
jgi:hypothetical protein